MFPKLQSLIAICCTFLVSISSFAGTNPFLASADAVVNCSIDGSQLSNFVLCGANDVRTFQVDDPDVQSVDWQVLDASSCGPAVQDCPNLNGGCSWNTVATSGAFTLDSEGEYRVILTYPNSTMELFYAKSSQSTYSDTVLVTKIISVNGGSDGEITIAANGNAPFIYQISSDGGFTYGPFQNSPVFENLSAGDYQIKTRDSSGVCEFISNQVVLTEPEVLVGQSVQTRAISCIEGGEIQASASGGVPPYQYALNGIVFTSNNVFSNLSAGTYSVEVRDANNAGSLTNSITITDNLPITVTTTVQDVTCGGMQDGRIEVDAFGGSGIYQYTLMDAGTGTVITFSSPITGNQIFENLAPGAYVISVQDTGGCISEQQATILELPAIVTTINAVGATSNQSQDGSITVAASGGTGMFQYAISPNLNEFTTSNIFTGLGIGNYTILTQDQNGCVVISDVQLSVTGDLVASLSQTIATCVEGSTVETSVTGGVPPYQYSLNGSPFVASNIFSGLPTGIYNVEVRDSNNATVLTTIQILDIPPITASYIAQDVTCYGLQDGLISVEAVTGGTGTYEYQLGGNPFQNSNVFEGLAPGAYNIRVRDLGGCVLDLAPIVISEAQPLVLEYTTTNSSDDITNDGTITLAATGGAGSYEYSIDGGSTYRTSNVFDNLAPGQYQVSAIDAAVCPVDIGTVVIGIASPLSLSATIQNQISCNSQASVLLTPSGGTPPYEYSSNGSSYRTTNPFITGSSGSTIFTVRDATGATVSSNAVTITAAPESISVNVGSGYDCNGVDLPQVNFQLTRGSGNMEYSIYDGIWQTSTTFLDVPDGNYMARAKNENCEVEIPITVKNVVPVNVRVLEQNEGWVKFQILSGTGPFDYRIDAYSSPRNQIGTETIFEVDGFSPGPHWLVIDGANCSDHVTFDIEGFIPELEIETEVTSNSCFGAQDASISVTGVGGLGEYNYGLVDGDNNIIYPVRPEISNFQGLTPGTYKALVRDTRQGLLVRSDLITITEPEELAVSLDSTDGSHANSNTGAANLRIEGGTAPYEYRLDAGMTYNPLENGSISELAPGDHIVTIRDANGCQIDTIFEIGILPELSTAVEIEYVGCEKNSVTVVVSGGSGQYLFALNSDNLSDAQSSNIFANIPVGTHYVAIFDANGHMLINNFVVGQRTIQMDVNAILTNNETKTTTTVNIEVEGGNAPYTFSKDGISYQETPTFNDLTEGDYTVYVKDALGCMAETTVTVEFANDSEGSSDAAEEADIIIYQNPGRTEMIDVLWDMVEATETTITIYNSKGTLVYGSEFEDGTSQAQVDVTSLSRGIYFVYIKNAEIEEVKKVLIQ